MPKMKPAMLSTWIFFLALTCISFGNATSTNNVTDVLPGGFWTFCLGIDRSFDFTTLESLFLPKVALPQEVVDSDGWTYSLIAALPFCIFPLMYFIFQKVFIPDQVMKRTVEVKRFNKWIHGIPKAFGYRINYVNMSRWFAWDDPYIVDAHTQYDAHDHIRVFSASNNYKEIRGKVQEVGFLCEFEEHTLMVHRWFPFILEKPVSQGGYPQVQYMHRSDPDMKQIEPYDWEEIIEKNKTYRRKEIVTSWKRALIVIALYFIALLLLTGIDALQSRNNFTQIYQTFAVTWNEFQLMVNEMDFYFEAGSTDHGRVIQNVHDLYFNGYTFEWLTEINFAGFTLFFSLVLPCFLFFFVAVFYGKASSQFEFGFMFLGWAMMAISFGYIWMQFQFFTNFTTDTAVFTHYMASCGPDGSEPNYEVPTGEGSLDSTRYFHEYWVSDAPSVSPTMAPTMNTTASNRTAHPTTIPTTSPTFSAYPVYEYSTDIDSVNSTSYEDSIPYIGYTYYEALVKKFKPNEANMTYGLNGTYENPGGFRDMAMKNLYRDMKYIESETLCGSNLWSVFDDLRYYFNRYLLVNIISMILASVIFCVLFMIQFCAKLKKDEYAAIPPPELPKKLLIAKEEAAKHDEEEEKQHEKIIAIRRDLFKMGDEKQYPMTDQDLNLLNALATDGVYGYGSASYQRQQGFLRNQTSRFGRCWYCCTFNCRECGYCCYEYGNECCFEIPLCCCLESFCEESKNIIEIQRYHAQDIGDIKDIEQYQFVEASTIEVKGMKDDHISSEKPKAMSEQPAVTKAVKSTKSIKQKSTKSQKSIKQKSTKSQKSIKQKSTSAKELPSVSMPEEKKIQDASVPQQSRNEEVESRQNKQNTSRRKRRKKKVKFSS